jgi:hypothetical protein
MKTKLLLILSLFLLPSLSYGISKSFRVTYNYDSEVCDITVHSSEPLKSGGAYQLNLTFVCRDLKIYKADNSNYSHIKTVIRSHFPKHIGFFENDTFLEVPAICAYLQKISVWNNYMVTHVNFDTGEKEGFSYDINLYKPD